MSSAISHRASSSPAAFRRPRMKGCFSYKGLDDQLFDLADDIEASTVLFYEGDCNSRLYQIPDGK